MSLLSEVCSAMVAILVFITWVRPATFKFLLDKDSQFPSLGRQGQFTALMSSTWVFVLLAVNDNLTEWFFIGFMVTWAGAQATSAWLKIKGDATKDAGKA